MHFFHRGCVFSLTILLVIAPFVASADDIFTTKTYVDKTKVAIDQSTRNTGGTVTNTNAGDIMQVANDNGVGKLTRTTPLASLTSTHTADSNKGIPTESAVVNYAVQKPVSNTLADGKVLTFTSATATDRPEARYIKVPVANGDPNASGTNVTATASIWLQ